MLPCSRLCPKAWSPVSVGHESGWDSGSLARPHTSQGSKARLQGKAPPPHSLAHGGLRAWWLSALRPPAPAAGTLHGASFTGTVWQLALPDGCGGGSRALCLDHRGAAPLLPCSRHQKQARQPSPRWGRGLQRVNSRSWGPCEPRQKLRSTACLFGGPS